MELKGAVALVTVGSEGIGRGIAEALKAEGSMVTITGRREAVLRDAARQIGVEFIAGDVGSEPDAVRTVAAVVERHRRLDILVNNAGYDVFKPLVDIELEEITGVYRTLGLRHQPLLAGFWVLRLPARAGPVARESPS